MSKKMRPTGIAQKKRLASDIRKQLEERSVAEEDIICWAKAGLNAEGEFQDTVLVLNREYLWIFTDCNPNRGNNIHVYKGYTEAAEYAEHEWEVTHVAVEELERVWIEDGVGCNIFVYLKKGETAHRVVCGFTNRYKNEMHNLVRALEQTSKGEVYEQLEHTEEYCPKCGRMYPDEQRKICPHCMDRKNIFFRVMDYFKPYKVRFVLLIIATIITAALNLVWPYLNGTILYDRILAKNEDFLHSIGIRNADFVVALLLLILTMLVTKLLLLVLQILQGVWTAQMVVGVVRDMKKDVFGTMGKQSISFYKNRQTGGLMTRVMSDADRIIDFFIDGAPNVLIQGFTMIASIVVMLRISVSMSIVTLAVFPVLILMGVYLRPKIHVMYGRRHRAERSLNNALNDNLTGARVVKSFGQEEKEIERFTKTNRNLRDREIDITYRQNFFQFTYGFAQSVATMGAWFVGVYLLMSGKNMNLGVLMTFVGYVGQLQGPLNFFSRLHNWWADSMNSAERLFEIIDAIPEVQEPEKPVVLGNMKGDISIRNMSFGYDRNRPVLKNLDLEIPGGKMYGIVGRSGAGKTTLVNLISRMYDVREGSILIDGVNVKDLSFDELRRNVAMVSQDTYIFTGTVAQNIAYAKEGAGMVEIMQAAKLAGAHEFIMRMPDGYDTMIGSTGRSLSGGERQRISIARAILADPKILILDEATASVDTETERIIQKSLGYLVQGRTTLSIAHRLSTLRDADYLVVIDNGEITERGTHKELEEQKGTYYKLLELQTKALQRQSETF